MQVKAHKNEVNMLSGSIFKGLLGMTIPIMIMNVFTSIFNFIDMTMIGNFAGDSAVGSVGACGSLIVVFTSLLTGLAVGSNAVVARHIARGEEEKKEKAIGSSMFIVVAGGLLLMVLGLIFAKTFLTWMNVSEELLDGAVIYFKLYFL
jgi:Na+-driven multidrug efflux pump